MTKKDIKLIASFIDNRNPKQELNFALVKNGAIFATDTRKVIQFNAENIRGVGLVHKKLLQGIETILGKDEMLCFENGYLHTENVKLSIDTAFYIESEDGKRGFGAKADKYPDIEKVIKQKLPFHFVLENINNLQWELAQKNCFIADIHLNPVIAYSECTIFDIYYEPQTKDKDDNLQSVTVKIVASNTDESGVLNIKFIAVFGGTKFESQAKEEK